MVLMCAHTLPGLYDVCWPSDPCLLGNELDGMSDPTDVACGVAVHGAPRSPMTFAADPMFGLHRRPFPKKGPEWLGAEQREDAQSREIRLRRPLPPQQKKDPRHK